MLLQATGPEEMKFPQKCLYTYNVCNGDSFILDEKAPPLPKLKTAGVNSSNRMSAAYSPNPKLYGTSPAYPQRQAVTFAAISPRQTFAANSSGKSDPDKCSSTIKSPRARNASSVKRNLFGSPPKNEKSTKNSNTAKDPGEHSEEAHQPFKIWPEDAVVTQREHTMDVTSSSEVVNNNNEDSIDKQNIKNHSAGSN